MFLLDTNVISELRKAPSGKANQNVIDWAQKRRAISFYVSVITILEIELGVLQIERRDPSQGSVLRNWFHSHVLPAFQGRILPIDTEVAHRCAKLHVPDPRSDRDAFIAATALVHGMSVVTRNVKDYIATDVEIINPWEAQSEFQSKA